VNLEAARQEMRDRGVDYIDDDVRLTFWLNQAKNIFEDAFPFPWLEATASGVSPLVVSDLKDVLYVRDSTNDSELIGFPPQQIVVNGGDLTLTGTPECWWLDGENTITAWPVSTSVVVEVRYVKESPELAAGTDTPLIPARFHPTWVDLAMIRAYVDRDNYAAAQALQQMANFDLAQIVDRYATRNRQNPGYQTVRAGSEDW
jgi:hypothetical protein